MQGDGHGQNGECHVVHCTGKQKHDGKHRAIIAGLVKSETKKVMIFGVEGSSLAISLNHQHVILVPDYAYKTAKEQNKLSNPL